MCSTSGICESVFSMTYSIHLCFPTRYCTGFLQQHSLHIQYTPESTARLRHSTYFTPTGNREDNITHQSPLSNILLYSKEPTRSYCTSNSRAVGTTHTRADDKCKATLHAPYTPCRTHCLAQSTQEGNQRQPSWRMSCIAMPLQTHAQIAPHRSTNDWSSPSLVTS